MGDYLLTLKGSPRWHTWPWPSTAINDVSAMENRTGPTATPFEATHGRLVRCRVFASTDGATCDALGSWPGLRIVLAVGSIHKVNRAPTKGEAESRYFLSSRSDDTGAA